MFSYVELWEGACLRILPDTRNVWFMLYDTAERDLLKQDFGCLNIQYNFSKLSYTEFITLIEIIWTEISWDME